MEIVAVLGTHENSPTFKDTLESIRHYLTDNVLVVVDGFKWDEFKDEQLPVPMVQGFLHGKDSAPFRNVALGLKYAQEVWNNADWYVYIEYDCLVGSSDIKDHLKMADEHDIWMLGNDLRITDDSLPFLDSFMGTKMKLHYFLGCCVFLSGKFVKVLAESNFFDKFLTFTNFRTECINLVNQNGKLFPAYDLSEYMYPTLAVFYGGKVQELACWSGTEWRGNFQHYPMRFRPDLTSEDPFVDASVMHPIKDFENPIRQHHRIQRGA